MIRTDIAHRFRVQTSRTSQDDGVFHPAARATASPHCSPLGTIEAIREECHAAGQRSACPLRVPWGEKGRIGPWYEPLSLWRGHADGPLSGGPVLSGHDLPEEAPGEALAALSHCRGAAGSAGDDIAVA
jgi:haloacetate dehalogenase